MNYKRHFDGQYCDDDYEVVYSITTLHNPNGLEIQSHVSGRRIRLTIDDILDLADRLKLHDNTGAYVITTKDLLLKEAK